MAEISDIMIEKLAKAILRAANTQQTKKPEPCTADAEVLRVENDTAYVHITGGAPETPVRMGMACHAGDTVEVRLENGKASLAGDPSSPPTDDTKAEEAAQLAEAAGEAANKAQETADNIKQYFWFMNGKGSEAGAHVTEVPRAEFQKNPQGGNLLLRSNSVKLRMALITLAELTPNGLSIYEPTDSVNPVAQFLSTGVQIGKSIYNYIKITTTYGLQFFWNSTLRATINGDGITYEQGSDSIVIGASQLDCYSTYVEAPDISMRWGSGSGEIAHYKPVMGIPVKRSSLTFSDDHVELSALDNGVFEETEETLINNSSITAWGVDDSEVSITKAGYYPLAISGIYSSTRYFCTTQFCLKDQTEGSAKIDYMVYNANSSSRTGTVKARVLWLKTSA